MLPGTAGSPPKVLTMEEVENALKNVEDMTLAHEIAINPEFKLKPYSPPDNSLEKRIKTILHDVFWDLLRDQLKSDPPCYDQAICLLGEIKEVCSAVLPLRPAAHRPAFRCRDSHTSFPRTTRRHWSASARCSTRR